MGGGTGSGNFEKRDNLNEAQREYLHNYRRFSLEEYQMARDGKAHIYMWGREDAPGMFRVFAAADRTELEVTSENRGLMHGPQGAHISYLGKMSIEEIDHMIEARLNPSTYTREHADDVDIVMEDVLDSTDKESNVDNGDTPGTGQYTSLYMKDRFSADAQSEIARTLLHGELH